MSNEQYRIEVGKAKTYWATSWEDALKIAVASLQTKLLVTIYKNGSEWPFWTRRDL